MIWAMMQNKKTFTKPLAVIHQGGDTKGALWEVELEKGSLGAALKIQGFIQR